MFHSLAVLLQSSGQPLVVLIIGDFLQVKLNSNQVIPKHREIAPIRVYKSTTIVSKCFDIWCSYGDFEDMMTQKNE
jgi:hypothetical protein